MLDARSYPLLVGLLVLVCLAQPTYAFGAGNIASISKIEGQNWRHGDIEDALLTLAMARAMNGKKFSKMMVSRVYFGNWLRDYSQAIDVGTVKSVSAEAIRLLLCVLGFLTFGFGSKEFEVTADRLGCYRPEDHIDNPKNYADNEDARQYDRRLRGPVDEGVELAIDPETGMKNYIANEQAGIMTSAAHARNLFSRCIELARGYSRNKNQADLYEAMRLMGTGLHCLEDFFAHSNYCELALIEMGERDVFPHVGRDTRIRLNGARDEVYPIVTGTFGGVDFLHSVTGEVSDKLTQNEIEELEGTLQESKNNDTSILRGLLDMIPDGIFGGKHQSNRVDELQSNATSSQLQNMQVSPREPEEYTRYIQDVFRQIMPAIEFHDEVLQGITEAIEKIPVLPKILEQLEEQLSKFVFSLIAPFILPVINQIRNELRTGSAEIIESSEREQHIVFEDDRSTDPTHSMLSKDHFTNILNEVAGRCAAKTLHWVVPQLMEAIDDESIDVNRTLNRIIFGVLHHPAQRDMGEDGAREGRQQIFKFIEEWWNEMDRSQQDEYRRKLTREGVERGENHREGVHDTGHGHGCSGKLHMRKQFGEPTTWEDKVADKAAGAILEGVSGGIAGLVEQQTGVKVPQYKHKQEEESSSGGGAGGLIGSILGGVFGKDEKETQHSSRRDDDGGYTQTTTEYGHHGNKYGQAEYSETQYSSGGGRSEYRRYEQEDSQGGRETSGYEYQQTTETRPSYGGGYEQRTETHRYEGNTESGYGGGRRDDNEGGYGGRRQEESSYGGRQEESYGGGYGGGRRDDNESSYGRREESYGGGRRDENESSYGGRQEESYGGGYGGGRRDDNEGSYGRQEGGYGGGRRNDDDDERREGGGGFGDFIGKVAERFGDNDNNRRW
ncbi:heterokaryon incompatibility protein Het-C [Colletotrichum graminicola]|uniref:Heterokaryon incompatibility protein Het-C n=1 Tax=Colletotrichum graminicola (strain M1.001 / M2 / FGSC 10212) TaxID=645133 RepID=E3Q4H9_COLGM|nr:heterokaryon incompatibility protein Het-C [Colletotrichum graminicola M1.001]EFQ25491.1 heterokaryon incompatibility protein Het-C [Colletotrichum graminicola M1.001]WDK11231.1 heterokaryon incompatibility protein Het-C [Colletotrichum graminicola]